MALPCTQHLDGHNESLRTEARADAVRDARLRGALPALEPLWSLESNSSQVFSAPVDRTALDFVRSHDLRASVGAGSRSHTSGQGHDVR